MRKLTQQEFINKAKLIHGDIYIYDLSVYVNIRHKIIIICKIHGKFEQIAHSHLNGKGCGRCGGTLKKTNNEFIEQANIIHNYKYDYSNFIYKGSKNKSIIICIEHGKFYQTPNVHLMGHGCPKCAGVYHKSLSDFIEEANLIHDYKYNYIKSIYINFVQKIEIICKTHGAFWQTPREHLGGSGCPECGRISFISKQRLTLEEFVGKAKLLHHDKYDYSKSIYINNHIKIEIVCRDHGSFWQRPSNHLIGDGCPSCHSFISKKETAWLDKISIPQDYRSKSIYINQKRYLVDAYDPITNTIYEFYGNYWHGNPKLFNPNDINTRAGNNGKTFFELYDKTIKREQIFKSSGYNFICIWEDEYDKQMKNIK